MSQEDEAKNKTFRIKDETAEKFRDIAATIGGNQQETMAKLIETFEFQQGKVVLADKKEEIETFEKYANILTRMFMNSLEDNQNITDLVKTQFDALLKSKDTTILDLQDKYLIAQQLKENSELKAKTLTDENANLCNKLSDTIKIMNDARDSYEETIVDKNKLNKALADSYDNLKNRYDSILFEFDEFKQKAALLDKTVIERDNLLKSNEMINEQIKLQAQHEIDELNNLKAQHSATIENIKQKSELSLQKALLDLESKYQDQIQKLKEEKQREVDKYQDKYFILLEQKQNGKKELQHNPEPKSKN